MLRENKLPVAYEPDVLPYKIPESLHKYKPDFRITDTMYIEAKGKFVAADRQKMLLVKEQHPNLKICILFQNAFEKIRKGSKTTYAMWCDKHGIEWSHKIIKKEWINEVIRTRHPRGRKSKSTD